MTLNLLLLRVKLLLLRTGFIYKIPSLLLLLMPPKVAWDGHLLLFGWGHFTFILQFTLQFDDDYICVYEATISCLVVISTSVTSIFI